MKIMHSILYVVVILVGLLGHLVHGCPTCVGKLEKDSPAFFSDEYYQAEDADAPIEQAQKSDTMQTNTASQNKEAQS